MKNVVILGATGSIGCSALDVCEQSGFNVTAVAAGHDFAAMEQIVRRYKPHYASLADERAADELRVRIGDTGTCVLGGADAAEVLASTKDADIVLNAIVGIAGLRPTLAAIDAGHDVALANKETLVTAGELVNRAAAENGVKILPVDSEHSAVFQCLQGAQRKLAQVILTASGGPFFGYSSEQLKSVTKEQALRHPNWSMGRKITIDCATMMNKGLELIEAVHLFGVSPEQVDIIVHRQSVVHSMVRFGDNSVIAQLGVANMRLPIQYALCYPYGGSPVVDRLDLKSMATLTFAPCDEKVFRPLALARQAISQGGTAPAALNGANECAVAAFLDDKIPFYRISEIIEEACGRIKNVHSPSLADVFEADRSAREQVDIIIGG